MEKPMNKMEDMEMDMVAGGRGRGGFRRSKNNTNSMAANIMGATENANSMAANIDETQNARWREIAKVKPD